MFVKLTLDNTFGAGFVGGIIATFLYGITFAQILRLIRNNKQDPKVLRYSIGILWILDTAHVGCVAYILYYFLVTMRGQITSVSHAQQAGGVSMILANTSDLVVRAILLSRIFILSKKSVWLCLPVGVVMVVSNGIGVYCAVVYSNSPVTVVASDITWTVLICLAMSVFIDVALSVILCLLFRKMGAQAGMSHPLLHRLSRYVIGGGIFPSVIALAALITYVVLPGTFIYMGFYFTLSKSTLNSMLYLLNARQSLREVSQKESLVQAQASLGSMLQGSGVKMPSTNKVRRRAATIVQNDV